MNPDIQLVQTIIARDGLAHIPKIVDGIYREGFYATEVVEMNSVVKVNVGGLSERVTGFVFDPSCSILKKTVSMFLEEGRYFNVDGYRYNLGTVDHTFTRYLYDVLVVRRDPEAGIQEHIFYETGVALPAAFVATKNIKAFNPELAELVRYAPVGEYQYHEEPIMVAGKEWAVKVKRRR